MNIEQNKEIVRAFVKAINERDWERLDDLVDPRFILHSHAAPPVNNREELEEYLRNEFEIFPDGYESIGCRSGIELILLEFLSRRWV